MKEKDDKDAALWLLRYIGVDNKNLRELLLMKDPFQTLSSQDYVWTDLYGKKASFHIEDYMKAEAAKMQEQLRKKSEDILKRFEKCFLSAFQKKGDADFVKRMLDADNPNGFYDLIEQEKELYGRGFIKTYREMTTGEFCENVKNYMLELGLIREEKDIWLSPAVGKVIGKYPEEFMKNGGSDEQ